jgi:hypothetical protein
MDFYYFLQIVGAVIGANALCFAFFMGMMKASRLQKQGVKDDELPLWVYPCLIAAPAAFALGAYLWS